MFSFWIFNIIISCSDSGVCPESNPRPNLCLIKICMFSIGLFHVFLQFLCFFYALNHPAWILLLLIPSLRQWCMPRIKPSAKLIYRFHRTEVVPILGKGPTTESPFALTFGLDTPFSGLNTQIQKNTKIHNVKNSLLRWHLNWAHLSQSEIHNSTFLHFRRNRQSGNNSFLRVKLDSIAVPVFAVWLNLTNTRRGALISR